MAFSVRPVVPLIYLLLLFSHCLFVPILPLSLPPDLPSPAEENAIRRRIEELKNYRVNGIRTMADAEQFEAERRKKVIDWLAPSCYTIPRITSLSVSYLLLRFILTLSVCRPRVRS